MVARTPMATITTVSMTTPAPTAAAGSNLFLGEGRGQSNQGGPIVRAGLWMGAHLWRGK